MRRQEEGINVDVRQETTRLRGWFELTADPNEAGKMLVKLWEARAWEELGHGSWREYCEAEFPVKPKWHKDIRRELVGVMSSAGLSQRDVGAALGVDQKTVANDLTEEISSGKLPPNMDGLMGKWTKVFDQAADLVGEMSEDDPARVRWASVALIGVARAFEMTPDELAEFEGQWRQAVEGVTDAEVVPIRSATGENVG